MTGEGYVGEQGRYDGRLARCRQIILHLLEDFPQVHHLDPLWAIEPETGKLIPDAVSDIASNMKHQMKMSVDLPCRWWDTDTTDLDRSELRAVLENIDRLRNGCATESISQS